jgi:hypothetical protein
MIKQIAFLGLCIIVPFELATLAHSFGPQNQSGGAIVLAQLTPEQAQCQQEAAQLQAQLAQCATDQCRQSVQTAIDAHNQRCQ